MILYKGKLVCFILIVILNVMIRNIIYVDAAYQILHELSLLMVKSYGAYKRKFSEERTQRISTEDCLRHILAVRI